MTIEGVPIYGLTAPALLGIAILLLLLGKIVPRSTLLDRDKQIEDKSQEAERWRQAYETEREARSLSNRQTIELLEVTKLTNQIVMAAFGPQGVIRKSGGADEAPT
jgi:hypothetical protein